LIEAQYFGVPVVASDVGGVCEAIDQERTGFAISGGTPQDYAAKVVGVLQDAAWRARAAAECRRFVLARFDLDGVVDRLRGFYFGTAADGAVGPMSDAAPAEDRKE
jgi:phosphatidyl-myo-inositol dimannoside synthase